MKTPAYVTGTLTALLLFLAPGAPAHASGAGAPERPETVVALTFDDGDATHVLAAHMLRERGMRGTFYVNSATLGGERKLTRRQLRAIAEAGHEIGGHTLDHTRLTELTPERRREQICDDRKALLAMGHRVTTLAYPFGAVDADAMRTARQCGYSAARTVGGLRLWDCPACPAAEPLPPRDPFRVRTPGSIRDTTVLRQLKQQVYNAEKGGGGLLPLVLHRVCDDCGVYSTSPAVLGAFLDWLATRKSRGTTVKPFGAVFGAPVSR
ncbi:polysaccharide deacetylase family protein [Planomonospora sp. ID67723]|uniref:polysaccharide deacetylase family protein n=1 Tax=Planomonospora sp. ID67723 TaxID=2738134 RepID=UPI0018C3C46F|nr:polysaccharide deacetylase family protein [Planomonospora sp. ID67723]MBG0828304.1 polysaccharide deacetylase family protein [Planomonospora sp. ID67723]